MCYLGNTTLSYDHHVTWGTALDHPIFLAWFTMANQPKLSAWTEAISFLHNSDDQSNLSFLQVY
jgi:hypothetical protein